MIFCRIGGEDDADGDCLKQSWYEASGDEEDDCQFSVALESYVGKKVCRHYDKSDVTQAIDCDG